MFYDDVHLVEVGVYDPGSALHKRLLTLLPLSVTSDVVCVLVCTSIIMEPAPS
jgi:hypothetical protein